LTLMTGGAVDRPEVLAAGLVQPDGEFDELPNVAAELESLQKLYGAVVIKDQRCTQAALRDVLDAHRFSIVHIATHGEFQPAADETFLLLFHGSKLKLDDLARLIQPNQFRAAPVDLLTLSACQTATGDQAERAALGLGGIALKAGARSALATLWYVNDEVSAELVGRFYKNLHDDARTGKAKALRAAQLHLLADPNRERFRHPCYWSPYLLIGSWE